MAYHVPTSAIPLLEDPPFVIGLVLLGTALGWRTLRLLHAPLGDITGLERGTLSAAVGLGLLQYLPYALGMAHLLTPFTIRLALVVLQLLLLRDILLILAAIRRRVTIRSWSSIPGWIKIGALILLLRMIPVLLTALCPGIDGDGLGYHLAAPKRWLQSGDLHYLPTFLHTNAPMGVEMLYTIPLAVWSDTAAKFMHFALGTLAFLAIFAAGRRLHSAAVGFMAASIWFCGMGALSAATYFPIAFVDLGLALEVTAAVLAWILWRRTQSTGWLRCAALCAGFAASFKLTGVFVGFGLAGITLAALRQEGMSWKQANRLCVRSVGLALIPVAPWLVRTWIQTGDPIYPLLPGLFHPRDWSPEAAQAFQTYFRYFNLWGPPEWGLAQRQAALFCVLVGAASLYGLLLWRVRQREPRTLVALAGFLLLTGIAFTGLMLRLVSHLFPLALLLLGMALSSWLTRSRIAQSALLTVLAINVALFLWRATPNLPLEAETAMGRTSRQSYLTRRLNIMPLWDTLNRLPQTAENEGAVLIAALQPADSTTCGLNFYCDRDCFVTDAYLQARIRMDTWEHYLSDIRSNRIAYVVAPKGIVPGYVRIGPDYAPAQNEFPFARRLVTTYGRLMIANANYELYKLQTPS